MYYLENLIALTPNQHFGFAHPNNNTHVVDLAAQKELLIAKTCSIKNNLECAQEDDIYDFQNLLEVLKEGWNDESVMQIRDGDYADVLHAIETHY